MSENARYRLLQGGYWMLFCAGYGYVTVYLLDWGYAAAQIGAVTAVFGLLAALGQPVLGKIADRGGRWGWKPLLLLLAGLCLAAAAALLLCPAALKWLFYGLFLLLISSMMPLINAASFYYAGRGVAVMLSRPVKWEATPASVTMAVRNSSSLRSITCPRSRL